MSKMHLARPGQLGVFGGMLGSANAAKGVRPFFASSNSCAGCSRDGKCPKVSRAFPRNPKLIAVGMAPGADEEKEGVPFVGRAGQMLRPALAAAGLDHREDVGYLNLARCRPEGDDFSTREWQEAEDRCWAHVQRDLAGWRGPILLLGSRPVARFLGQKDASVLRLRGLWHRAADGRDVFAARHPAGILRAGSPPALVAQFRADVARCAARVLGTERAVEVEWRAFPDLPSATRTLLKLAKGVPAGRWAFDIETFDAAAVPSRAEVATDPFHPDFRVRGVAVAVGPRQGFWVELAPHEGERGTVVTLSLAGAFASGDEKEAFFGSFDENGLVAPGWVPAVRNRTRDPFLAAQALDASGLARKSLAALAVDVLGEPQPGGKDDRGMIRSMPLDKVAEYAVRDACLCWRLGDALRARLARGDYL